jgi:hypothetical protein
MYVVCGRNNIGVETQFYVMSQLGMISAANVNAMGVGEIADAVNVMTYITSVFLGLEISVDITRCASQDEDGQLVAWDDASARGLYILYDNCLVTFVPDAIGNFQCLALHDRIVMTYGVVDYLGGIL